MKILNNKKVVKMMTLLTIMQLALFSMTSCEYREYADADYPENMVYQPLAGSVLTIDSKTNISKVEVPTTGESSIFVVDKANGKLVLKMGVVQSGVNMVSANVNLRADVAALQTAQTNVVIPSDAVILSADKYSMPESLKVSGASTPYELQVSLDAIKAYPGKMVAVAVTLTSANIAVSETLATQIILIDADFINAQ